MPRFPVLFTLGAVLVCVLPVHAADASNAEFFETKVRPVFVKNCYSCHTTSALGGLRLDSLQSVIKGGKSGPAVIPGKAEESLLIQAVRQSNEALKMPPSGKLKEDDLAALVEWVNNRAVWPESTSFFESKVQPIFAKNCYSCHTNSQLGGLRLDSREAAMKGGNDGEASIPGQPTENPLLQTD